MKRVVVSLVVVAAFVAMVLARFALPGPATHAHEAKPHWNNGHTTGIPSGSAYIAYVNVPKGPVPLVVGPLVPAYLNCNVSPSATNTNSLDTLNIGSLGTVAVAQTSVKSTHSNDGATAQSTAVITNLNILGGKIKATLLRAQANSSLSADGANSNGNGTTLANVVIGNIPPIKALPAPNTVVNLAGLGTVTLNEQKVMDSDDEAHIIVNLVHVHITLENTLGLPIGADIIVGHAESDVIKARLPSKTVSGHVYDLSANVKIGSIKDAAGPLTSTWLPCTGGTSSNQVLTTLPLNLGRVGVITERTQGNFGNHSNYTSGEGNNVAAAEGEIRVADVYLLQGLIALDAVNAKASVVWDANDHIAQNGSTVLLKGMIAGLPLDANIGPNTKITLANLGYIVLNEQIPGKTGHTATMAVNALHIYITTSNLLGLPIGANIIVGHVDVGIQGIS